MTRLTVAHVLERWTRKGRFPRRLVVLSDGSIAVQRNTSFWRASWKRPALWEPEQVEPWCPPLPLFTQKRRER